MTYFTTGAQLQAALNALPNTKTGNFVAFDSFFYGQQYMADYQGTLSPIEHFVQIGAARGYKPNATFDPTYYKNAFADLKNTDFNAADLLYHFMQYGLDEGRAPSEALAKFDGNFYLAANPDVAEYVNANLDQFGGSLTNGALAHYVKFGGAEGRSGPGTAATAGRNFILEESTVAGVKAMVLHGDQDIRIDMTKTANQITGLDLNGDGKTVVTLNVYTLDYSAGDTQTESDAYLTMAGTTKLATDVAGGLSSVFLLYDPAGFQESTGSLRYLDGTLPEAGSDSDWWNMVYRWTDCPVLAGLDLHLAAWTRRPYDTRCGDANIVLARLSKNLGAGDILLMHDGNAARGSSGRAVILDTLPALLDLLHQQGLTTVTLHAACS